MTNTKIQNLLTVIVNHNCNKGAIHLKQQFAPLSDTLLMDSGSTLQESEEEHFDAILGNVYYNGLLNEAWKRFSAEDNYDYLLFITSDVEIENPQYLVKRTAGLLSEPTIGAYCPSTTESSHPFMNCKGTSGIRKVTFPEGFCFAVKKEVLSKVCPVDTSINKIGHGVDIYIGYVTLLLGMNSVVDDKVVVYHPNGSGYSDIEARKERDNWFDTKSVTANMFHRFVSTDIFKNKIGFIIASLGIKLHKLFNK